MKLHILFSIVLGIFLSLAATVFGATYYVAPNGSNDNPGTEAYPWQTLSSASWKITNGDMVLVRGGVYRESLTINDSNVTFQAYSNEEPIIDGNGTIPAGGWTTGNGALILINSGATGVTIDGFTVRRSTAKGIYSYGDNATIKNCTIYECYRSALVFDHADGGLAEDCDIYENSMCIVGGYSRNQPLCDDYVTAPSEVVTPYSKNITFRRCKVHDAYNEGFNIGRFSEDVVVEYCELWGNKKHQIYACNTLRPVIRYNLIYGTNPNTHGQDGRGNGIVFANEAQFNQPSLNMYAEVYGNFVANVKNSIWVTGASNRLINRTYVYNNTIVEAPVTGDSYAVRIEPNTGTGHIFKNNIVWNTNANITSFIPAGKITGNYNLWSREPSANIQGPNDPDYAVPRLAKTTGWTTLTGGSLSGQEFNLQETSPAIDVGTNLITAYSRIPDCSKSFWPGEVTLISQSDHGYGWEIGGDIHVDGEIELENPKNVLIKVVEE